MMTLEGFAKGAGVEIVKCSSKWGGTIGYTTEDNPNTTVNGFRTREGAYIAWLYDTFGRGPGNQVLVLLKETQR